MSKAGNVACLFLLRATITIGVVVDFILLFVIARFFMNRKIRVLEHKLAA
jgi:hypothetical protein